MQEVIDSNQGKSPDQLRAIFEERKKQFSMNLEQQAIEGARSGLVPQMRKGAQEELIEERLKLQEAKKNGIEVTDDEVRRILKGLAEHNKMTEEQFVQHLKGLGVDATTLKERFRAMIGWREVVRRRFSAQISVTQREIDRAVSASGEAGDDGVELHVQKITLSMPTAADQASMAKRFAEAEALRRKFGGCKTMAGLAKDAAGAKFEDLKYIKPSSITEPTRSHAAQRQGWRHAAAERHAGGHRTYRRLRHGERSRPTKSSAKRCKRSCAAKEFEIARQAPPARYQAGCAHRIPMRAVGARDPAAGAAPGVRRRSAARGDHGRPGGDRARYYACELAGPDARLELPPFVLLGDPDLLAERALQLSASPCPSNALPTSRRGRRRSRKPCRFCRCAAWAATKPCIVAAIEAATAAVLRATCLGAW